MDLKQFTKDYYFEFKYLNETKLENLNEPDRVSLNTARHSLQTALKMLNELTLDEVVEVRKMVDLIKDEELEIIAPLQRVESSKEVYDKNLDVLNHAAYDAKVICCLVEAQKLDESV